MYQSPRSHVLSQMNIGLAKTHLQHLLTGAAMNVVRLGAWFAERPRAATRPNKLALLLVPPLTSGALA